MKFEKVIYLLKKEQDIRVYEEIVKDIEKKMGIKFKIYVANLNMSFIEGAEYAENDLYSSIEYILNNEKPQLLIMTKLKLDPFSLIFSKPEFIKIAEKYEDTNILFLDENIKSIDSIAIALDIKDSINLEGYIDETYSFSKSIGIEPDFVYSFSPEYYELALKKTHVEKEAKTILDEMLNEHINRFKFYLDKIVGEGKYKIKILHGEPKKEIPYFVNSNNYSITMINKSFNDKISYLENIEGSVGIF